MTEPASQGTHRRPLGVVVIAAFLVIDAVLAIAGLVFDLQTGTRQDVFANADGRASLIVIVLVAARLVAAIGLWSGWRRAWVLAMLLVGISLVIDLWLYWNGTRLYVRMAIDVVLALYLNQGSVRDFFEPGSRQRSMAAPRAAETEQ